ncbi:MAG: hypothetical protein OIF57_04540 [Marinobacterium sp.]|nr:hypothetical protein [Marinobacterium sp.]
MAFSINTMPQSIYQPLGVMNLPGASLDTLSFKDYQQKQQEALRVDPAVEAQQLQVERAQAQQHQKGGSELDALALTGSAQQAGVMPVQNLEALFFRQQLISSIAAGEAQARTGVTAGIAFTQPPLSPANPAGPITLDRLDYATQQRSSGLDIEALMAARNSHRDGDAVSAQTQQTRADDAQQQKVAAQQRAETEARDRADEISRLAEAVRDGKTLGDKNNEEQPDEVTATAGNVGAENTNSRAQALNAVMESAASHSPSLSHVAETAEAPSSLAEQIRTRNFITEIQQMQAMQFATGVGTQLETAA